VVDAVIFDLDGVILDSEPVWEEVRRTYVADHGGRWQPDSQKRLMGMSTSEWAHYLSAELGVDRTPDQVAREVVDQMVQRYAEHVPLIVGANEHVRRLASRWPLGLASSSPTRLIEVALKAAGLTGAFHTALSTETVAKGKPAPDIYLAVAERMGVPPTKTVAIEDSSNGVRSADNAGMHVIAAPHPRYPLDDDAARRAKLTINSLDELTGDAVERAGADA